VFVNVDHPIRFCLSRIHHAELDRDRQEREDRQRREECQLIETELKLEHKHNVFWTLVVIGILLLGGAAIVLIVLCRV
jgi:hypothetical protein